MKLFAKQILLADGWAKNITLTIKNGVICKISDEQNHVDESVDIAIPGMVNCHSHAFQRVFAGCSESLSQTFTQTNNFHTWREKMYAVLAQLNADDLTIIAKQLYIEMLKRGYTRVAEFHYLHHQVNGQRYKNLATTAEKLLIAAQDMGIGITLLPVLYQYGGFNQQVHNTQQQRFINSVDQFKQLLQECFFLCQHFNNCNLGIAPHSLRAVEKNSLISCLEKFLK